VPKIVALLATYRLLTQAIPDTTVDWHLLIAIIAAASMTLGNLAAFLQTNARRLLAYSTISQIGYLLMAVAAAGKAGLALPSLGFYLAAYTVTNLGAFAVVAELPHATDLRDYTGLFTRHRWLALSLAVCLLGLVGTPPTAVFVGKLTIFTAAFDAGLGWLVILAAINTAASLFYYLRWITPMFQRSTTDTAANSTMAPSTVLEAAGTWGKVAAYTAAGLSVTLGVVSGPLLDLTGAGTLLR
jgi:NADH-quinone oxidoreductase subunit N